MWAWYSRSVESSLHTQSNIRFKYHLSIIIGCRSLSKASVSDPHFFADLDPGKNLHAVTDPDPGGKGKK